MKAWKLMARMMVYRPWLYALNGALWMMVHGAFIIPGLLVKAFFDALQNDPSGTGRVLWLMIAFTAARICHIYVSAWVDILHRFTMSALLRSNAFEAVLGLPGAADLSCSSTEALDYIKEDSGQVEDAISWTLDVLGSAVFTVVSVVLLLRIDAVVTMLAFVPLVLVVAIAQGAEGKVSRYREAARKASEEATGAMGEVFGAIQAIKVAGVESHALTHVGALCETRRKAALKDGLFNQLLDSIYHNTVGIGTGIILIVIAARAGTGGFSLGDFSLFIFCLSFVSDYTCFWGGFLAHYQQTRVSFDRLKRLVADPSGRTLVAHVPLPLTPRARTRAQAQVWEREREKAEAGGAVDSRAPGSGAGGNGTQGNEARSGFRSLELAGFTCLHPSGKGIRDVDLTVGRGEFVVVTGRIGSGKTTLLRAIQGLLPSTGDLRWNGEPVVDPAAFFIPPRSAYTPQSPALLSDTLAENLRLGLEAGEDALMEALRAAALEADLSSLPDGLETRIGPRGLKLSGGQAQRTAAARMFLRKPELYFIDDMSSALDAETERTLWNRFAEAAGRTCIAVSHRRGTLELADRVIVMKDGRVEAQGPLAYVLDNSGEMRRLWGR